MDRSFLSQPEVIRASRQFVCIRLTTYEDKGEANFLKSLFVGGSGELENTTFAILAPDGKRRLVRASRSARHSFSDAREMATAMSRIARQTEHRSTACDEPSSLPKASNVRLALDVAAADNQSLAILFAKEMSDLAPLENRVRSLAWGDEFIGRFIYVSATSRKDMELIDGLELSRGGIAIVQPDEYGLKGKALVEASIDASSEELRRALARGAQLHRQSRRNFHDHVREGHRRGILWETAIPVTDPMELQARERGKRR